MTISLYGLYFLLLFHSRDNEIGCELVSVCAHSMFDCLANRSTSTHKAASPQLTANKTTQNLECIARAAVTSYIYNGHDPLVDMQID